MEILFDIRLNIYLLHIHLFSGFRDVLPSETFQLEHQTEAPHTLLLSFCVLFRSTRVFGVSVVLLVAVPSRRTRIISRMRWSSPKHRPFFLIPCAGFVYLPSSYLCASENSFRFFFILHSLEPAKPNTAASELS